MVKGKVSHKYAPPIFDIDPTKTSFKVKLLVILYYLGSCIWYGLDVKCIQTPMY